MRIHFTIHRKALKNRTTRRHLRRLQHNWNNSSDLERGRRLRVLLDRGCSIRGLAQSLERGQEGFPVSEATLRRCLELTRLPEKVQAAVEDGRLSGDAALLLSRDARRCRLYLASLAVAEAKEREIRRLMDFVDTALDRVHLWPSDRELIVSEVEQRIWYRELLNERDPVQFPIPSPAPGTADPWKVFDDCRPVFRPSEEPVWYELLIVQLTDFLPKIAPTAEARDEALCRLRNQYKAAA